MAQLYPVIHIENVGKVYNPEGESDIRVEALKSIDLKIEAGEFVAIMGASGSGKSTLMNILGCLDLPTLGKYFIDGIAVNSLSRDELSAIRNRKIGFVFQGFNLIARTTALDNVELPLLYNKDRSKDIDPKERALQALDKVGLANRKSHHSSQLSGGQQQRVAIARALVNDPSLILADEPTGNLDTTTSNEIMALFQELNTQGITIVLVTHEPDIAAFTKRIVDMRDGKIISDKKIRQKKAGIAAKESSWAG